MNPTNTDSTTPSRATSTEALEKLVIAALEDIKAKDIEVLDTTRLTPLFDRVIVASADSNRQTRALARNVHDKAKEAGFEVLSVEGEDAGEWVLVDLADVVVHIMQPATRSYYNIEELWSAAPSHRPLALGRRAAGGR